MTRKGFVSFEHTNDLDMLAAWHLGPAIPKVFMNFFELALEKKGRLSIWIWIDPLQYFMFETKIQTNTALLHVKRTLYSEMEKC